MVDSGRKAGLILSHTGLRGIAAFSVFMWHLYELENGPWGLSWRAFQCFHWSGPAVDLFFMLSGFVLNHVYLHSGPSYDWKSYVVARVARITPLYYLTLLIFPHKIGVFAAVLWNLGRYASWWGCGFVMVVLMNLFMLSGVVDGFHHTVNPPSWSISVEIVLYVILFPILAAKARDLPCRWAMLLGLVSSTVLCLCHGGPLPAEIFGWSWTFLGRGVFGFIVGFIVCSLFRKGMMRTASHARLLLVSGCILMVCILALTGSLPIQSLDLVFPLLLLITAYDQGLLCGILLSRIPQWLGERSYSIYLWHYPILAYYNKLPGEVIGAQYQGKAWINTSLMILVVLAVSAVSYRYFEVPMRDLIRRLGARR
jgi:peptidoglycan/LPS O-acetylase OafA/YrhL